jgi:hypothetical protein
MTQGGGERSFEVDTVDGRDAEVSDDGPLQARGLGAGPSSESLVRRKPRGGKGAVWSGATYGDFGVADGALVGLWGRVARVVRGWSEDDELFRWRGCELRVWAWGLERVCGRCEDIAFLQRRAAGGEGKRRCAAGSAAIVMRCRS